MTCRFLIFSLHSAYYIFIRATIIKIQFNCIRLYVPYLTETTLCFNFKFTFLKQLILYIYKVLQHLSQLMEEGTGTQIEKHILRKFNILKKVGSGAYGHVWKVEDRINKKIYALKKIFDAFQHSTDAQRTYRQIQILRQTQHPNIIKLYETIRAENNKDVYLVFQFMEADLHNVIAEGILKEVHIRFIIYQLAKALKYLHTGLIIHRDLKPSNILINSNCSIKLCDFGLVRSLVPNQQTTLNLTEGVATRWYRAPEVLLGSKSYSTPADIWSFGCIIYEILAQKPLFPGNSTVDQIDKILAFSGYPSEDDINGLQSQVAKSMLNQSKMSSHYSMSKNILKQFSPMFTDLLMKMLAFNPSKRIKIQEILNHQVVIPFKKVTEEVSCDKQIRTSIDDNKKLSVDEYRGFVYGTRRPSSVDEIKNNFGPKKSSSYSKISSGSTDFEDKKKLMQRQTLKYVRSSKVVSKSMQNDSKPTEISNIDRGYRQINKNQLIKTSDQWNPGRITYISNKNMNSPKMQAVGPQKQKVNVSGLGVTGYNSPKFSTYTKDNSNKLLYKSSKYVLNKVQTQQK